MFPNSLQPAHNSSSSFLHRFQGKIQSVTKEGVAGALLNNNPIQPIQNIITPQKGKTQPSQCSPLPAQDKLRTPLTNSCSQQSLVKNILPNETLTYQDHTHLKLQRHNQNQASRPILAAQPGPKATRISNKNLQKQKVVVNDQQNLGEVIDLRLRMDNDREFMKHLRQLEQLGSNLEWTYKKKEASTDKK